MELASQTLTRTFLAAAALAAALATAAPAWAGWQVVLADGRSVAASTRPVIALGRVNFHDANGRAVSLVATEVDVEATRRAVQEEVGVAPPRLWTAERLAASTARLQVLGSGESSEEGSSAGPQAEEADGDEAPAVTQATVVEQRELIEERIDRLVQQRRSAPAGSPLAQTLDKRAYLLRSELARLRTQPVESLQVASR